MKKFLKFALRSQWKTIVIILFLVILQIFLQIEIINLFKAALAFVEFHKTDYLFNYGKQMLLYTIFSLILLYAISFLLIRVSSNVAFNTREKLFHILMGLSDDEVNKFKITGLITRSTRGVYSLQGFITLLFKYLFRIPFVFMAIIIEIALIDGIFAGLFAAFIIILFIILIFKLKQVTTLFFKAKKTYGKLNSLFLCKINNLVYGVSFKKLESEVEFEDACRESYDENITYRLSQYYIAPVLLLAVEVIVVLLLAMMVLGYPIGFEAEGVINSVVIIQYILYFITTLDCIPMLIELWPRSYATSIRLEEVLSLEDNVIKTTNDNSNSKGIEIIDEDIADDCIPVDRRAIIGKFNKVLAHHRREVIISIVLVAISTLCLAYAPKVAGNIINSIIINSESYRNHSLFINVALLFGLYSVGCLFRLPSNRLMTFVGEKISYKLRIDLFEKLDNLDSRFIRENSKGHILSRLNNDLMNVREFIILHISEIFAQVLIIFFVIILSLTTDWRLSLIYIATLPIYMICFYCIDVKSKGSYENHKKLLGGMMSYFERSLTNRNTSHEQNFKKINRRVSDNFVKSRNVSNILLPIATFLTNLSNIAVYIVGLYFIITNQIQLGTLLAIIIYGQLLTKPLKKLSVAIIFIEISFSSMKRIFNIIDFKNEK